MKLKKLNVSSQLLILLLAALVMGLMLQVAQAATRSPQAQVIHTQMPQKSLGRQLLENTTLSYYHQFLGPTVGGQSGESYNVFQEARTPYQSFHALSLSYRFNPDWAVGTSIAAVNAYGETTSTNRNADGRMLRDEFFNARAFVNTPAWRTPIGTLFTTVSYEHPTSVVAKRDEMQYAAVLSQSFAFPVPSLKLTSGMMWQYYRAFYKNNLEKRPADYYFPGSLPENIARQTTIFSIGPYLGYRFNDNWGMNSSVTFDWDQRGKQTGTGSFNNNLPDRARVGVSYYPTTYKQISNVGIFTQGLLKYTTDTQAIGGELALKF